MFQTVYCTVHIHELKTICLTVWSPILYFYRSFNLALHQSQEQPQEDHKQDHKPREDHKPQEDHRPQEGHNPQGQHQDLEGQLQLLKLGLHLLKQKAWIKFQEHQKIQRIWIKFKKVKVMHLFCHNT